MKKVVVRISDGLFMDALARNYGKKAFYFYTKQKEQ